MKKLIILFSFFSSVLYSQNFHIVGNPTQNYLVFKDNGDILFNGKKVADDSSLVIYRELIQDKNYNNWLLSQLAQYRKTFGELPQVIFIDKPKQIKIVTNGEK